MVHVSNIRWSGVKKTQGHGSCVVHTNKASKGDQVSTRTYHIWLTNLCYFYNHHRLKC